MSQKHRFSSAHCEAAPQTKKVVGSPPGRIEVIHSGSYMQGSRASFAIGEATEADGLSAAATGSNDVDVSIASSSPVASRLMSYRMPGGTRRNLVSSSFMCRVRARARRTHPYGACLGKEAAQAAGVMLMSI